MTTYNHAEMVILGNEARAQGRMDALTNQDKKAMGMYGETPKVFVGKFTISQQGGNVWIENGEDEGMECSASIIERALQDLWDNNF